MFTRKSLFYTVNILCLDGQEALIAYKWAMCFDVQSFRNWSRVHSINKLLCIVLKNYINKYVSMCFNISYSFSDLHICNSFLQISTHTISPLITKEKYYCESCDSELNYDKYFYTQRCSLGYMYKMSTHPVFRYGNRTHSIQATFALAEASTYEEIKASLATIQKFTKPWKLWVKGFIYCLFEDSVIQQFT